MTRTVLALSPHLDDAVFSCGGALALLARSGWRVVVATLFTRSVARPQGFALACQLDKGLGPEIDYMSLRRAEDRAAMQRLGAFAPLHADLPEAPHRGYENAAALFQAPRPDDVIVRDIEAAVVGWLGSQSPDLVLAPQAIGGHVDHVQLVHALGLLDLPVIWWRDFPYAARTPKPTEPFRSRMIDLPERIILLDEEATAAREAACLAYASQLGFQFGGADGLRAKLFEGGTQERLRSADPLPIQAAPQGKGAG